MPTELLSLAQCLLGAQSSDAGALVQLIRAAEALIARTQRRYHGGLLGRSGMAEDARQEALVAVWRHFRRCRGTTDAQVAAWIRVIALSSAVDVLRRETLSLRSLDDSERWFAERLCMVPDDFADAPSARGLLPEILSFVDTRFGEPVQRLLWLRLVLGASWEDVGTELGISWTAARRRYQRVVAACRDQFAHGTDNPPDAAGPGTMP